MKKETMAIIAFVSLACIFSVVALIIGSVALSRTTDSAGSAALPTFHSRSNSQEQIIAAGTSTTLTFDTIKESNNTNSIQYIEKGEHAGSFQVMESGLYSIHVNYAVNVSGYEQLNPQMATKTSPARIATWIHKSGDTTFYGLNPSDPAEFTNSSNNSHYIKTDAPIPLLIGDSIKITAFSTNNQRILGGNTCYVCIHKK